jgi:hypothetical protein
MPLPRTSIMCQSKTQQRRGGGALGLIDHSRHSGPGSRGEVSLKLSFVLRGGPSAHRRKGAVFGDGKRLAASLSHDTITFIPPRRMPKVFVFYYIFSLMIGSRILSLLVLRGVARQRLADLPALVPKP